MRSLFISYDYDNDKKYKRTLTMWAENNQPQFRDITFNDLSTDVSVNSNDPGAIKRAISRNINRSDKVIIIIGKYTHDSWWCKWEIDKAKELNKPLIGIKLDRTNITPSNLYASNVAWAHSFTLESIKRAINSI